MNPPGEPNCTENKWDYHAWLPTFFHQFYSKQELNLSEEQNIEWLVEVEVCRSCTGRQKCNPSILMQAACPSRDGGRVGGQRDKCLLQWRRHSNRTKERPTHSPTLSFSISDFLSLSLSYMHTDTAYICFTWLPLSLCLHVGIKIKYSCNSVKQAFPLKMPNGNSVKNLPAFATRWKVRRSPTYWSIQSCGI